MQDQTEADLVGGPVAGRAAARHDVAELMVRLAAGDMDALLELHDRHGHRIIGALRAMVRRRGVEWLHRDELDGLLVDACLALVEVADRWDPEGGALPWVWARHRLEAVVDRHLGQHADELDADRLATLDRLGRSRPLAEPAPCDEPDLLDLLDALRGDSTHGGQAAIVREALARAGSERDQRLLLEVRVQEALGDRSPAATVAPRFGMQPAAVRQQVRRVTHRLRALAATEDRFAALADLPLVA